MSDESSSTPLRLKPKVKVEPDGASATSVSPLESGAGGGGGVEGDAHQRLRLKPRLAPAEVGEAKAVPPLVPSEPIAAAPVPAEPKVRLKPRLTGEGDAKAPEAAPAEATIPPVSMPAPVAEIPAVIVDPPAPMVGGFKLKPKSAAEEPPPLPAADAIGKVRGVPAGPMGGGQAPEAADAEAAPPPKFRIKPSPDVVKSFDETAKVQAAEAAPKRRSPLVVVLLVALLLGAGGYYGYYGYQRFLAPSGEPAAEPTASAPTQTPSSLAGQMVAKARDAATAQAERFQGMEEAGIETRTQSGAASAPAPASGVMVAMPPRVETPPPAPEPSAAFTRFVTEMRISGVFQGDPPRALINGRTIRAGEPIDIGLGIVFVGLDVDRRLILMREASGATAAKKY